MHLLPTISRNLTGGATKTAFWENRT